MSYRLRTLLIILVTLGLSLSVILSWWAARASVLDGYQALIQDGRNKGYRLENVDAAAFKDWIDVLSSPEWKAMQTSPDAFSASFPALRDAGLRPDIYGYLDLLSMDFPPGEQLGLMELMRWREVAALRFILASPADGRTIQVYDDRGTVYGIRLPDRGAKRSIHFAVLENGK